MPYRTVMNWGTELWDQYENLSSHTQKGIDFLENFGRFIKDRCSIETDYAAKLRKLVKNYQPRKKDDDENLFSTNRAFRRIMNEINDLAGQHEVIAETLQSQVIKELTALIKDIRDERKKHFGEGTKLVQLFNNQKVTLERSKKNYEKAFRESERAVDVFQKADNDMHVSKAEVERQRTNMQIKSQMSELAKSEYAEQLQRTNEQKRSHYFSLMPEVFRHIQDFDERRIKSIKSFFYDMAKIEKDVIPIILQCIDGIVQAADSVNEKEDSQAVIEKYKSGFTPPNDFEFEDLSQLTTLGAGSGSDISGSFSLTTSQTLNNKLTETLSNAANTIKGTVSMGKNKKRAGIFSLFSGSHKNGSIFDSKDDFSYLPPNQQKKRLNARIEEINKVITQQNSAHEGLMRMKNAFEDFPNYGNPMTVESQIVECVSNLEKLRSELERYEQLLANLTTDRNSGSSSSSSNNSSSNINSNNVIKTNGVHNNDDGDFSRSNSESSVSTNRTVNINDNFADNNNHQKNHLKPSVPEISQLNFEAPNSPESSLGMSHTSLPNMDDSDMDHLDAVTNHNNNNSNLYTNDEFYYETDVLPPLGICKAIYPFRATSEGSIPIEENEEVYLIELDQGDGWTRVRRLGDDNSAEEGFVPTTYIEIRPYNQSDAN